MIILLGIGLSSSLTSSYDVITSGIITFIIPFVCDAQKGEPPFHKPITLTKIKIARSFRDMGSTLGNTRYIHWVPTSTQQVVPSGYPPICCAMGA